jgi:hypothetical protein
MPHPVAYGRVLPPPDRDPRLAELLDRIEAEASASYRSFRTPAELGRMVRDDLAVLRTSDSSDTPPNTPRDGFNALYRSLRSREPLRYPRFRRGTGDLGEIRMNYAAGRLTGTRSHPGGRPRTCPGARRLAAQVCRRIAAARHAASIASTM